MFILIQCNWKTVLPLKQSALPLKLYRILAYVNCVQSEHLRLVQCGFIKILAVPPTRQIVIDPASQTDLRPQQNPTHH